MRSRAALATVAVLALAAAPTALADGDPASDTLVGSDVYFPYAPVAKKSLRTQLRTLTRTSRRNHYKIKVALIQSPADLGSYPQLFGHPTRYARLLYSEITYFVGKRTHLLVVMPQGFGGQHLPRGWRAALHHVRVDRSARSNGLVRAAITGVLKIAQLGGHPLAGA